MRFSELLQVIKIDSMKKLISITSLITIHFVVQAQDIEYVISRYNEFSNQLQKIEYQAHNIDTFASGSIWNKKGYALIEKDKKDSIFGFSFYGKRSDFEESCIYQKGTEFSISTQAKSYKIRPIDQHVLGSPGGQMIAPEIFHLDSIYETRELIETKDKYILKFHFKDIIISDVTKRIKIVEIDKENYLVRKVINSYVARGNKAVHQVVISDIKINEEVQNSIDSYKSQIENFTLAQHKKPTMGVLINKHVPDVMLSKLNNENSKVNLNTGKVTLLDFWEVWCGPCIKSLPEVEKIKQIYADKLQVIGIITQDKEKVFAMIEKKNITVLTLQGNKELLRMFGVNSYPRYFLIDDQGIVRQEYSGFSEQIEKDLADLINKK